VYLKENFCTRIPGNDDRKPKKNVNFPTNKHQTSTTPPEKNGLKKNTWEDPNPFYTQKTFNHVEPTNIFV